MITIRILLALAVLFGCVGAAVVILAFIWMAGEIISSTFELVMSFL